MSSNTYDDAKYGLVERLEFKGLQWKSTLVNDSTILKRYYPKGPIKVLKVGVRHVATQGGTDSVIQFKSSTTFATVIASTDSTPWRIASKNNVEKTINQGSYIAITNRGTVASGTVSCFMDFVRIKSDNWNLAGYTSGE